MSEYKNKRTPSERVVRKRSGGTNEKRNASYSETRRKNKSSSEKEDTGFKPRKRFDKDKENEKQLRSSKKSSDLVPKIKKSFSDYKKDSKSGTYKKKVSGSYSDSNKSKEEREDKSFIKKERKSFDSKDNRKTGSERSFDTRNKLKPFKKNVSRPSTVKKESDGTRIEGVFRLNRYIAASGMCSRREADELITLGEVKVNGKVVTEMGTKVTPVDRVEVGGQSITPEKKVYILLNKPKDFVSTVSDPHADRTVLDLVKLAGPERIYPVGRLDKSTTGVMLLTNDGDLTKKLTHPSYNKKKVYHAVLDKPATKAQLQQILEGIVLEDGFINVDAISFVKEGDKTEVGVELHSGRNRIVRRIFEHLGFRVEKLDRVYFAGLTKKNLPRGKWRYLSDKEVSMLLRGAYE